MENLNNNNNQNNQNQDFRQQIENNDTSSKTGLNTWIIVIVVGIIAGVAIAYTIFTKESLAPSEDDSDTDITITDSMEEKEETDSKDKIETVMAPENMSIEVSDQVPGTKVQIDALNLTDPAWVVTFDSTEDGTKPFKIIGAQYFNKGSYSKTSSFVAEGIIAGNNYFVALYKDDGVISGDSSDSSAGHVFNHETDKPFTDKTGAWIIDSFKALSTGSRG